MLRANYTTKYAPVYTAFCSQQLSVMELVFQLTVLGAPWSRGSYGTLSFDDAAPSTLAYTLSYGNKKLTSISGSLFNATGPATTTSGNDASLGEYDEVSLSFGDGGVLAVRYFTARDAFVFDRRPGTTPALLPSIWPAFSIADVAANSTRCMGWASHYFFPGTINTDLTDCESDGPLVVFDAPVWVTHPPPSPAFVISPLNHFSVNAVYNCPPHKPHTPVPGGAASCSLGVAAHNQGVRWATSALLVARPGFVRSTRAFGAIVRAFHNTTRSRGPGVTQLSFWNDNQAAYSWWTVGSDQSVWGIPEEIYLALKKGYDAAEIPVMGWEPDNNFVVDYNLFESWKGNNLSAWNITLYPSDGVGFVKKLGNIAMTYYTNGFTLDNAHQKNWPAGQFVKNGQGMEPHPNSSLAFYSKLWGNAVEKWNMEQLFTDFLCYRGPAMATYSDVAVDEDGEHLWLKGMTLGATQHGAEVQFCMALPHQLMMSLEWPGVTNARANGDGGLATQSLVATSLLASMVGLGWSKDNLRTADRCYNDAYWPNGTVKWTCNEANHGQAVNGEYVMQVQQTMLATLSLGPVGISDQLSAGPRNKSATITSNKTLVMATVAATGDLLQPSFPLAPIERILVGSAGVGDCNGPRHIAYTWNCGTNIYGTFTATPLVKPSSSSSGSSGSFGSSGTTATARGDAAVWWTSIGFVAGRGQMNTSGVLYESDLAPMVDAAMIDASLGSFDNIPRSTFLGAGLTFPNHTMEAGHVWWSADFVVQALAADPCASVDVVTWSGSAPMSFTSPSKSDKDITSQINIAPVFSAGSASQLALLGEAGKVTAVSTYRFAAVEPSASGLTAHLRGKAGEVIKLLFAKDGKCVAQTAIIGADGTGVATIPA